MPRQARLRGALAALIFAVAPPPAAAAERPPQYVLISFDGANDVAQWARSRALARRADAHFTYFLSCVFLLTPETRKAYQAPGRPPGRSNVGFAPDRQDVAARLSEIWGAHGEGHEIASHGCGHFDGGRWTKQDWTAELSAFSTIFANAWSLNRIIGEPVGWRSFAAGEIRGFRAPYLSADAALYDALQGAGFAYDASGVSKGPAAPGLDGRLARFALPQIVEGPRARRVIAMDYNLFVRHSRGLERPGEAERFEARAYEAFLASFQAEFDGARRPLQIGFHFTLMNGGAYWRALERFAETVCRKPEVACVTYGTYLDAVRPGRADARPAGAIGG